MLFILLSSVEIGSGLLIRISANTLVLLLVLVLVLVLLLVLLLVLVLSGLLLSFLMMVADCSSSLLLCWLLLLIVFLDTDELGSEPLLLSIIYCSSLCSYLSIT